MTCEGEQDDLCVEWCLKLCLNPGFSYSTLLVSGPAR